MSSSTQDRKRRRVKEYVEIKGFILAPQVGFEPTTLRLTAECSTIELLRSNAGQVFFILHHAPDRFQTTDDAAAGRFQRQHQLSKPGQTLKMPPPTTDTRYAG